MNDIEKPMGPQSWDKALEGVNQALESYKRSIDSNKHEFNASDRKKLLSLPFLLERRQENCNPK